MRKTISIIFLLSLLIGSVYAADVKIAYIDSEQIMANSKDTQEAQKAFENDRQKWENQLAELDDEIRQLELEFETRSLTLTEAGKKEAEEKIAQKQEAKQKFIQEVFGENGEAMKRNKELLDPILQKIQTIIEQIALEDNISLILDANSGGILYAKPSLDITERVIDEMNKAVE